MPEFKAPKGTHVRFDEGCQEYHLVDDDTHEVLVANEVYNDFVAEVKEEYGA